MPTLQKRRYPEQKRAQETFERILDTASIILDEVGFDKLNTNLIGEKSGLTPPAIYRYFPNKYSILCELGERLMDAQNVLLVNWLKQHESGPISDNDRYLMLLGQFQVVEKKRGGKWIMRSLRSVPLLADVRLESNAYIVEQITNWQLKRTPKANRKRIQHITRITSEAAYAMIEMLIDIPTLNVKATLKDTSRMIGLLAADTQTSRQSR